MGYYTTNKISTNWLILESSYKFQLIKYIFLKYWEHRIIGNRSGSYIYKYI
jgi:hypothetical protein